MSFQAFTPVCARSRISVLCVLRSGGSVSPPYTYFAVSRLANECFLNLHLRADVKSSWNGEQMVYLTAEPGRSSTNSYLRNNDAIITANSIMSRLRPIQLLCDGQSGPVYVIMASEGLTSARMRRDRTPFAERSCPALAIALVGIHVRPVPIAPCHDGSHTSAQTGQCLQGTIVRIRLALQQVHNVEVRSRSWNGNGALRLGRLRDMGDA